MDNDLLSEDRIHILEIELKRLQESIAERDNEIKIMKEQKSRLEDEYNDLLHELRKARTEIERLKVTPLIIGNVKDVIDDSRVVVKSSTGPDFIVSYSGDIDRSALKSGVRVSLNKQTLAVMEVLSSSVDPIVSGAEVIDKPSITYEDIGGLDAQMLEVREAVEYPLLYPERYKKIGIEPPKGVLLIGPPGTGKTLIAKAVAHHTNACFIRLVGSELVQKYIGEGARLVRELFELAKERSPTIIFLDELDSIGARRMDVSTSGDREVQRTLMQLLAELDGFETLGNVKIIGATNRSDILDDALLRPGRFDRIIEIPKPDVKGRIMIFRIHLKTMNIYKDVNVEQLAAKCDGTTGADIKAIVTEAGMFAIRDSRSYVKADDFNKAIEKVLKRGGTKATKVANPEMFR